VPVVASSSHNGPQPVLGSALHCIGPPGHDNVRDKGQPKDPDATENGSDDGGGATVLEVRVASVPARLALVVQVEAADARDDGANAPKERHRDRGYPERSLLHERG